jgi:hypothetical protein
VTDYSKLITEQSQIDVAQGAANKYDSVVEEVNNNIVAAHKLRADMSDRAANDTEPTRESRIDELVSETGIEDREYLNRNFDRVNNAATRSKLRKEMEATPVTRNLLDDPSENSLDDAAYRDMSFLERIFKANGHEWDKGFVENDLFLHAKNALYNGTPSNYDEVTAPLDKKLSVDNPYGLGSVPETLSKVIGEIPTEARDALFALDEGLILATGAALVSGTTGPAAPVAGALSVPTAFGIGTSIGYTKEAAEREASLFFHEARQMADEDGNRIDENAARGGAIFVGTVNGGLELLPIKKVLSRVPGAEKIVGLLGKDSIGKLLKHRRFRDVFSRFGLRVAEGAVFEGATEALQELNAIGFEEIIAAIDSNDIVLDRSAYGDRVVASAKEGFQVGAGMHTAFSTPAVFTESAAVRRANKTVETFEALAEVARDSEAIHKYPEKVQAHVNKLIEQYGSAENVYMDAEAALTFFQEVDGETLAQSAPTTAANLSASIDTGRNVEIPMNEFLAVVAPSIKFPDISGDIKLDADGFTANEAHEINRQIKNTAQQMVESGEGPSGIFLDIREKLVAIGKREETATAMATLWESVFNTMGRLLPITPEEFYAQFNIQIQNEKAGGENLFTLEESLLGDNLYDREETLSQIDIPDTTAYKAALAKFGEEGMTQEARMERAREMGFDTDTPLYHWTEKSFPSFIPSTHGKLGQGVYASRDEGYGSRYVSEEGGRAMPLYLRGPIATREDMNRVEQELRDRGVYPDDMKKRKDALQGRLKEQGFSAMELSGEVVIFDPSNIRSVNAAFDPDAAASPNLLYQSAENTAEALVAAPRITLHDLVGKKVFPIFADLTAAGMVYRGLDGVPIDTTELLGGPGFPLQSSYDGKGVAWAYQGKGELSKDMNKLASGADYVVVVAMSQEAHKSNATVANILISTVESFITDGRVDHDGAHAITMAIREQSDTVVKKKTPSGEVIETTPYTGLKDMPDFDSFDELHEFLKGLSFEARAKISDVLLTKGVLNIKGMPPLKRVLNELIDPRFQGINNGESLMVLEYDRENPEVDFAAEGVKVHPSYDLGVRGRVHGVFDTPIPLEVLFGHEVADKPQYHKKYRSIQLRKPVVEITQEMADRASEVESLQTNNAAVAALMSALAGNWADTTTQVKKGGVSPTVVEEAIRNSPYAATLTQYKAKNTIDDDGNKVKGLAARAKDGSLVFHRLANSNAFVGIEQGKDYKAEYGFEHVDLTDNEVAMVGVVNNTPGASGLGAAQVLKGIEEGVTVLDAFSVKSERFPDGFLPTFYSAFGFEVLGMVDFDPSHYTPSELADMKAVWSEDGWVEADGYPQRAVMKWRGQDDKRSNATVTVIQEGIAGLGIDYADRSAGRESEATIDAGIKDNTERRGDGAADSGADRDGSGRYTRHLVGALEDASSRDSAAFAHFNVGNETLTKIDERFDTTLYQDFNQPRGTIQMDAMREYFTITLNGTANLSTFLHESGHFFLEMMHKAASVEGADQQIKTDLAVLRDWLGVAPGEPLTRDHHEKFARAFEAYLMEGNAPNSKVASAFDSFKAWLTDIYKAVSVVLAIEKVQLNDDIRAVMDRMVGVEQGFSELGKEFPQMFESAEQIGMTEAEFERWLSLHRKSLEASRAQAEAEVLKDITAQQRESYKQRKIELQKEAEAWLDSEPVYQAMRFLLTRGDEDYERVPEGHRGYKLDSALVKDLIGDIPPKIKQYVEKDSALDADTIAMAFGFKDGVDLLDTLNNTASRKKAKSDYVKQRLDQEFGNSLTDGTLKEAVLDAYHSNEIGNEILANLKAIGRRVGGMGRPATQNAVAKGVAKRRIAEIPILKLNPSSYLNAEKKAHKKAVEAMVEGDYTAAEKYTLQRLLNHHMFKEAQAARKEADSHRKQMTRFTKKSYSTKLARAGQHFIDVMSTYLESVNLKSLSNKAAAERVRIREFIEKHEANDTPIMIPDSLREETKLKSYREMSLLELRGLRAAMENVYSIAKKKYELQLGRDKKDLGTVVNKLRELMEKNIGKNKMPIERIDRMFPKGSQWVEDYTASLDKLEFLALEIDGGEAGYAWETLYRPLMEASEKRKQIEKAVGVPLLEAMRSLGGIGKKVTFMGETWSMSKVYAVALNMGNRGNLDKMLKAEGWSEQQLLEEMQSPEVLKYLGKAEWETIQDIWDTTNSLWPETAEVWRRAVGAPPPKVEPSELRLEVVGITLMGGYYPIAYDSKRSEFLDRAREMTVDNFGQQFLDKSASTIGSMVSRVEMEQVPLFNFDLSVLPGHVMETAHFIAYFETLTSLDKIIKSPVFSEAFKDNFGYARQKALRGTLKVIAEDGLSVEDRLPGRQAIRFASSRVSLMVFGFNLKTVMTVPLGLASTINEAGPLNTLRGAITMMTNPIEAYAFAKEGSAEVRYLMDKADRDIRELSRQHNQNVALGKVGKGIQGAQELGFMPMMAMIQVFNVWTFYAGYYKAKAQGKSIQEAQQYGDHLVRTTQTGQDIQDQAGIQSKDDFNRLLTIGSGWFNLMYNRGKMKWSQGPIQFMTFIIVEAMIPGMIEKIATDDWPEEEENLALWALEGTAEIGALSLGWLGWIGWGAWKSSQGEFSSMSPMLDIIERSVKNVFREGAYALGGDVDPGKASEAVADAVTLGTGLPLSSPVRRINDVIEADEEDAIRTLLFGKSRAD